MIRVAIFECEKIPDSLMSLLDESDEVEVIRDFLSPDVLLIYSEAWNRAVLVKGKEFLASRATKTLTAPPIVVLCLRTEEPFATDSVRQNHVSAVLPVPPGKEQVVLALRAAAAGLKILPPPFNSKRSPIPEIAPLTPRELEILRLVADGEGNKSIAYLLDISGHTVKFHISSIFEKLHVSSRTEAVKAGITRGLISI